MATCTNTCPTCGEKETYHPSSGEDMDFHQECDRCRVRETYALEIHSDGMLTVSAPRWTFISRSYKDRHVFVSYIDCKVCKGRGWYQENHRLQGRMAGSTRHQCPVCLERSNSYAPRTDRREYRQTLLEEHDIHALYDQYENIFRLRLQARGIPYTEEGVEDHQDIVTPIREEVHAEYRAALDTRNAQIKDLVDAAHPPTEAYVLEYPFVNVDELRTARGLAPQRIGRI